MTKQELAKLRFQLITAVTDYDRKDSTKRNYNIYALPQYFRRIDDILSDVESGADPRQAIAAGFIGTLQNFVLRKLKMSGSSTEEARGGGALYYKPVGKRNPAEREIGSLPEQGKYTSFKKWAAAVKKIGGRLRSESPVRQTVYGPFGFISEWNGRSGKIEEFFDANPVRQRIAVSLSRSQARRNPLLESGATISKNSGINRRAASMT
jgi:hypothetical protein